MINTAYLRNGAYGMPAAALRYFQKPLAELSTGELAFLASLLGSTSFAPAPYGDLPLDRRNAAIAEHQGLKHRDIILDRMARMGALTAAAKREPLNLQL